MIIELILHRNEIFVIINIYVHVNLYTNIHIFTGICIPVYTNTLAIHPRIHRKERPFPCRNAQQIVRAKINVTLYVDILRQGYTSY